MCQLPPVVRPSSEETNLVCGREAVSQAAGVTVQPAVGVSPDGVVSEQGLSYWAGHLEHQTCYIWYIIYNIS